LGGISIICDYFCWHYKSNFKSSLINYFISVILLETQLQKALISIFKEWSLEMQASDNNLLADKINRIFNFFRSTLYIRVKPEHLSVLHVQSDKEFKDVPIIAIENTNRKSLILAVGHEANTKTGLPNVTVVNGFKHPRTLLADFAVAERTLKHFIKKAVPNFTPSPVVIIHPLDMLEGGLTQIEIRAFAELCSMAGARKVYVWTGPELNKEELQRLDFTRVGGHLLFP
jgi:rod shape-determining protein MreB